MKVGDVVPSPLNADEDCTIIEFNEYPGLVTCQLPDGKLVRTGVPAYTWAALKRKSRA